MTVVADCEARKEWVSFDVSTMAEKTFRGFR